MRIKQCKLNIVLSNIATNGFMNKYYLKPYYDRRSPSFFYGLWATRNVEKHKSLSVIIWRGTDIVKNKHILYRLKKKKNIKHIAISSYIANDLKKYGIKYKFIPIVTTNIKDFNLYPLGNEIYAYLPDHNPKYFKRYGSKYVELIQKKCKYKINISRSFKHYSRKNLIKIYERCFCGFRFTSHDGLPNQVIEMGLMGRRSFYNGNIPGSIKWDKNNIDGILENIEKEAKKIGTIDNKYSDKVRKFIDVGDKWLYTEFWEK